MKSFIVIVLAGTAAQAGVFSEPVPSIPSVRIAAAGPAQAPSPEMVERLFKADDEVVRLQALLGRYVVGRTISGPVLITSPVEVQLGVEYRDILGLFPALRPVEADGRLRVRLGADIPSEYARIRAEFMARLPRLILLEKATGVGRDLSRGHLVWARSLQVLSQPECVGLAGREPWPDHCS